jgi:hypothetical protein
MYRSTRYKRLSNSITKGNLAEYHFSHIMENYFSSLKQPAGRADAPCWFGHISNHQPKLPSAFHRM